MILKRNNILMGALRIISLAFHRVLYYIFIFAIYIYYLQLITILSQITIYIIFIAIGSTRPIEGVGEQLPGTSTDYLRIKSSDLFLSSSDGEHQAMKFFLSIMITSLTGCGKQYIIHSDPVYIYILIYIYI